MSLQEKYSRKRKAWRKAHPPATREELDAAERKRIEAGIVLLRDAPGYHVDPLLEDIARNKPPPVIDYPGGIILIEEPPMDRASRRAYLLMIAAAILAALSLVAFIRWTT